MPRQTINLTPYAHEIQTWAADRIPQRVMIANLQEQYGIVIAPSTLKLKLSQLGIRTYLPRRIQPPQEEQEEERQAATAEHAPGIP